MGHRTLGFWCGLGMGVIPHHARAPTACWVIRQILYTWDRQNPPLLSSRTSSYRVSGSDTCWVHRALGVPHDLPVSLCVSAGALGYVKHTRIWPRSSFLYAASLSENSLPGYTHIFNLKRSIRRHCSYFYGVFVLYSLRSCLSSSTWLFPKTSASKCLDYSGIHLYNACDNGIKLLLWEKSVRRMDYAKALPMGRWTQELSQPVSISSGCIASENCSDTAFHVCTLSSGETTGDGQATVVCVSLGNYRGSTRKLRIYCTTSISNLHLLYIRSPHMASVYLLSSRPWYRDTTELVCVFLLIAIMEEN